MKGTVSLVGAGPGDTGLLTLKALECLKEADFIIYDTLVNPAHLRFAKGSAARICVGKGFRHKKVSQAKINQMILRAVRKGQNVVRLKGGDPYLFGRGGEEALFLQAHRVPFQVVPGVTSATACAAYAGVPLTHREHNASVTFLTGHRADDDKLDTISWKTIVSLGGTLVIYMGFYNLKKIMARLVRAGMPKNTKTCVIEWGTLPQQRSCEGTVTDIASKVSKAGLGPPCLIIIGGVVALRKKLNWYERLPLFGQKVAITRSREKGPVLAGKLERLGAEVIEFPVIEVKKPSDFSPMDQAIRSLHQFDWVVFTSAYGVEFFFERLLVFHKKDARALGGVKIACVGPGTEEALKNYGVSADLIPRHYETKAIAGEFKRKFHTLEGRRLLLLRTNIAPGALDLALQKLGARTTRVTAYETTLPKKSPFKVPVDWVTFTSSSTADHFVKIFGLKKVKWIAKKTKFASIGPVTTQALKAHGLKPFVQAKIYTLDGLVEAMKRACSRSRG